MYSHTCIYVYNYTYVLYLLPYSTKRCLYLSKPSTKDLKRLTDNKLKSYDSKCCIPTSPNWTLCSLCSSHWTPAGIDSGSEREDPRCPTLYYGKNCEHCLDDRSGSPVLCDTPLNTSYLFIDFQLYYNDSKQIIAHSIFHTNRGKRQNRTKYYRYELMPPNLPDVNNFTCGSAHRTDYMCGHCIKGYGPAAYAYYGLPCAPCHHKTRGWLY